MIEVFRFETTGSRILRSTSGGSDNGAPPILDLGWGEVENFCLVEALQSAGARKSGTLEEYMVFGFQMQWPAFWATILMLVCGGIVKSVLILMIVVMLIIMI